MPMVRGHTRIVRADGCPAEFTPDAERSETEKDLFILAPMSVSLALLRLWCETPGDNKYDDWIVSFQILKDFWFP